MSKSCSCKANNKSLSVINDSCPDVNGSISVLLQQVFDSVKQTLDASPCTVTVLNPTCQPVTLLTAHSTSQLAQTADVRILPYNDDFKLYSADILFDGTCSFMCNQGCTYVADCQISVPFSALMKSPEASVIKPDLTSIGYVEIIRSAFLADTSFNCLCDGATVDSVTSFVPAYVPLVAKQCPVNTTCRQPEREDADQSLFPQSLD